MKFTIGKIKTMSVLMIGALVLSCEEFLDIPTKGSLDTSQMTSESGINGLLAGAYANLDGSNTVGWSEGHSPEAYYISGSNWIYGEVVSDNAHKGSELLDQEPALDLEQFAHDAANVWVNQQWIMYYDGVARANDVIKALNVAASLDAGFKTRSFAEARFLRGFFHFEAKKIWNMVPYVDELAPADGKIPNNVDIWPMIEADFQAAIDDLPVTQDQVGRVNKWTAKAYLAKAHMYQNDHAAALILLNDIINNGPFDLASNFQDLWNSPQNENNEEIIFAFQSSANDGAGTNWNGNFGDVLGGINGGPAGCCGFYVPTQNAVNAFKTSGGLPLLDTFNASDVTNDQGIASADPFTPYAGELDPRLDHSIGRRGIPFLDYGLHPGKDWVRSPTGDFGPYSNKKRFVKASDAGTANTADWTGYASSINFNFMRFAEVLLWAAECEAEIGTLANATARINRVRQRAIDASPVEASPGVPAANYSIALYPTFTLKADALKAIRHEHRLEFLMEGHRFFDLNRWGITSATMTAYLTVEKTKRATALGSANFVAGKNEYFPIPADQIVLSRVAGTPTLEQNPGY